MQRRRANAFGFGLCVLAASATGLLAGAGRWDLPVLLLLLALVVGADFLDAEVESFQFSGAFLSLILASALLGPAPAAVLGALATAVDTVRVRPRACVVLCNFGAWALYPLVPGVVLQALAAWTGLAPLNPEYVLILLPGFAAGMLVNHATIIVGARLADGTCPRQYLGSIVLPILPSMLVTVLLAAVIV